MGFRIDNKLYDPNKDAWFLDESHEEITQSIISNAYYGHCGFDNQLHGLHIWFGVRNIRNRIYVGGNEDLRIIKERARVKSSTEIVGREVYVFHNEFSVSGFKFIDADKNQLLFNFLK